MILDFTDRPLCTIERIRDQAHAKELIKTTEYADNEEAVTALMINVQRDSETWVLTADGEVACFWGVTPKSIIADEAYFWVLTTNVVKKWPYVFMRGAHVVVNELLEHYSRLVGLCEDEKAMKWLRRLGATFGNEVYGRVAFELRRE